MILSLGYKNYFSIKSKKEFEKKIKKILKIKGPTFIDIDTQVGVLKNLTSKKRHHNALSVISTDEDAIYDITIDKQDFHHTLEESLKAYEKQEKYEKCAEIKKAMDWLEKKKAEKAVSSIMKSLAT